MSFLKLASLLAPNCCKQTLASRLVSNWTIGQSWPSQFRQNVTLVRTFHTQGTQPLDSVANGISQVTRSVSDGASTLQRSAESIALEPSYMAATGYIAAMTLEKSLLGGIGLGIATSGKFQMTGRILGMSGTLRGLLLGNFDAWRISFMAGLAAGSLALTQIMPEAFQVLPDSFSVLRAAVAGVFVGVGTSMGSGCTSGHGICGNARFSKRSLVATLVFMTTAALVASTTNTAAAVGVTAGPVPPTPLTAEEATFSAKLIGGALASFMLLGGMAAQKVVPVAAAANLTEFAAGTVFALGLGLSGMLQPAKVASFLSPLSPIFDPSLMFVMGGALLVATPVFQWILRKGKGPVCRVSYDLPQSTTIDAPLVVGAALFGSGWGLAGICPAPALVNLAQPTPQVLAFVATMCVGMLLHGKNMGRINALFSRAAATNALKM